MGIMKDEVRSEYVYTYITTTLTDHRIQPKSAIYVFVPNRFMRSNSGVKFCFARTHKKMRIKMEIICPTQTLTNIFLFFGLLNDGQRPSFPVLASLTKVAKGSIGTRRRLSPEESSQDDMKREITFSLMCRVP